jgi:lipopolysaccharide export LptBFGC system permease protein LptF
VPHPLMVLAAPALAAAKFRIGGAGAVVLVAILVLAIAAIAGFAIQRAKRRRPAPPDDWERDQAQRR